MLPSAARLRRKSDFGKVYARGRSYATDLIVMYVLPRRDANTRVGFSVSGKVGKSVARNRTRRLLREAARFLLPGFAAGYDVVVCARAKATGRSLAEFARDLQRLAERHGLFRDEAVERSGP